MQPANRGFDNKISWYSLQSGMKGMSAESRSRKFQMVVDAASREYRCQMQPVMGPGPGQMSIQIGVQP